MTSIEKQTASDLLRLSAGEIDDTTQYYLPATDENVDLVNAMFEWCDAEQRYEHGHNEPIYVYKYTLMQYLADVLKRDGDTQARASLAERASHPPSANRS